MFNTPPYLDTIDYYTSSLRQEHDYIKNATILRL
jgi:hypothetical protein